MIWAYAANAQPTDLSFFDTGDITVCAATMVDTAPPDFSSDMCQLTAFEKVDPQERLIWVRTTVPLTATRGKNGEPLSLYLSGKMSSEVYLNGEFVGRNGMPAEDAASETPGRMDVELFPPQNLFRLGNNEVVFRASAHHGVLKLKMPLHMVGIAPAGIYATNANPRFRPEFFTLGLFVLGALYFGVMAFIGTSRVSSLTLSAICLFASGQFFSEALRGVMPYSYPVHDFRLLAITFFSSTFGLMVTFHVMRAFKTQHLLWIIIGLAVLSLISILIVAGFDNKALVGMLLPLTVSLIATAYWAYQRRLRAFLYFISLLVFVASIVAFRGRFLDTIFFLLVSFFLMLLFVDQAQTLAREASERRSEEARANRLAQALAEAGERTETNHVNVKSAGRMERIVTSQIIHCQGAGGYSEIVLIGGRTVLHSATLNEMEEMLPATFLRVHRSHLINVRHVKSLARDSSGTGALVLSEGINVPVSRRIMPKVRQALA